MSIPPLSARAVISGHQGTEIFQTGFWLQFAVAPSAANANTIAAALATDINTNLKTALQGQMTASDGVDGLKVYFYPSGGATAAFIGTGALSFVGSAGSRKVPMQVAQCITLHTALAGRRRRGRMFFPAASATFNVSGALTDAAAAALNTALGATFTAINADATVGAKVVVVSATAGDWTAVNSVSTDSLYDVQRRRSQSLPHPIISTATVS